MRSKSFDRSRNCCSRSSGISGTCWNYEIGIGKWFPTKSTMDWSSNSPLRSCNLKCSVGSQDGQTTRSGRFLRLECNGLTSVCGKHAGWSMAYVPPILDELGVVAAIENLISENSNKEKPEIGFVHHLDRERLAPSLENVIFRIVQESLTNARRYSQSERVLVRLTQREDYIRIQVQDWGIGFNPREVGDGHFGLEGIQERARLFGGSATIKSALGKGTRIVVELPLMGDRGTKTSAAEPDNSCRHRRDHAEGRNLRGVR